MPDWRFEKWCIAMLFVVQLLKGGRSFKKDCGMGGKNNKFGRGKHENSISQRPLGQLCRVPEDKEPKAGMWCEHAAHNRGRVRSNCNLSLAPINSGEG